MQEIKKKWWKDRWGWIGVLYRRFKETKEKESKLIKVRAVKGTGDPVRIGNYKFVVISCVRLFASPPGSSVHGIFQARILEWVAISFCRGSSWPKDRSQVSCTAGRFFTVRAIRAQVCYKFVVTLTFITDDFHQQCSADNRWMEKVHGWVDTSIGFVGQITQKTKGTGVFQHWFRYYVV